MEDDAAGVITSFNRIEGVDIDLVIAALRADLRKRKVLLLDFDSSGQYYCDLLFETSRKRARDGEKIYDLACKRGIQASSDEDGS